MAERTTSQWGSIKVRVLGSGKMIPLGRVPCYNCQNHLREPPGTFLFYLPMAWTHFLNPLFFFIFMKWRSAVESQSKWKGSLMSE